jgi:hypothetical protein
MELIKDYDFTLQYHPGKANTVADALSRKRRTRSVVAAARCSLYMLLSELSDFTFYKETSGASVYLGSMALGETLVQKIITAQKDDQWIKDRVERIDEKGSEMTIGKDGGVRLRNRLVVPKVPSLKLEICDEAHKSKYTVHPGSTKMYKDLRRNFWWKGMKRYVADYVSKCVVCSQVKIEHQVPAGKLQPLPIPEWKWLEITMDFVDGLPMS